MNRGEGIDNIFSGVWQIDAGCVRVKKVLRKLLETLSDRHFELVASGRIPLCARGRYASIMIPYYIKISTTEPAIMPWPLVIIGPEVEALPDSGALVVVGRLLRHALAKVEGLDEYDAFVAAECTGDLNDEVGL